MQVAKINSTVQLEEGDLLPKFEICPICDHSHIEVIAKLQQCPEINLQHCSGCKASFADRQPQPGVLKNYYKNYYADHGSKVTFSKPVRLAKHVYKRLKSEAISGAVSILDFGGGDGEVSLELARMLVANGCSKVELTICDFNAERIDTGDDRIDFFAYSDLAELPEGFKYNLVLASAILEHVPSPTEIFFTLLSRVKNEGLFYARTPYVVPIMKVLKKVGVGVEFGYPGHLYDLGADFWNKSLDLANVEGDFEIMQSKTSIVASTFGGDFFRTLTAYVLKMPSYVFRNSYPFVGGWEVFFKRKA